MTIANTCTGSSNTSSNEITCSVLDPCKFHNCHDLCNCGNSTSERRDYVISVSQKEMHIIELMRLNGNGKLITQEEAVAFATKYFVDRKGEIIKQIAWYGMNAGYAWDTAIDYTLKDIIPHIYGEALD